MTTGTTSAPSGVNDKRREFAPFDETYFRFASSVVLPPADEYTHAEWQAARETVNDWQERAYRLLIGAHRFQPDPSIWTAKERAALRKKYLADAWRAVDYVESVASAFGAWNHEIVERSKARKS